MRRIMKTQASIGIGEEAAAKDVSASDPSVIQVDTPLSIVWQTPSLMASHHASIGDALPML